MPLTSEMKLAPVLCCPRIVLWFVVVKCKFLVGERGTYDMAGFSAGLRSEDC